MEKIKEEEPIMHDVEVIGSVPDLTPYINEADIMILPIFKGSGMKVKTCESLMFGKNILGTDEAFEGYDADYERIGGKCNTADDFIGKINDFIASPRPRFNTYSRQLYLERYSESTLSEKMRKVLFD
jgi:glycosyltransferase involved in cell wall biosynthesis